MYINKNNALFYNIYYLQWALAIILVLKTLQQIIMRSNDYVMEKERFKKSDLGKSSPLSCVVLFDIFD